MKKTILSAALLITLAGCGGGGSSTSAKKPTIKPTQKPVVFTSKCSQALNGDTALTFKVKGTTASLNGTACSGSPKAFDDMMKAHPKTKMLNFIDMSGSMNDDANIQLAYKVRAKKLDTYISSIGHVASGGTDLFAAGVKRTIEPGARLGVHSWAQGALQGASLPVGHSQHKPYIDYYKKMGLPDPSGFYWFTLKAAPANGMHYMTQAEVSKYGLATVTTSYVKDLRANYIPQNSLLNNDLLDVISDSLKAVSVENNVRRNVYVLDHVSSLLFKQFNVSNRDELITYIKLNGTLDAAAKTYAFAATSNKPTTVYYSNTDKVQASYSSSSKYSIPAKPLIETGLGLDNYGIENPRTSVIVTLNKNSIKVDLGSEDFSLFKDPSINKTARCALADMFQQSGNLVTVSDCVESRLQGDVVQFVNYKRTSKAPLVGGASSITDAITKTSNFEFNAKQSTLIAK
ncbi:hypothetical protein Q5H80_08175 [Vibrio sp. SNU_ST1]|uniref:COG3904 family protein n=1 Tax=Vibrio sp. SNU_ST1 TaxID=3064001 RepID=UPI00272B068F|nr:hypothetical protein [Vibrio sp. SNU_ST1]WKY56979.1 hypothetical protein Q5H80_08175 [Vibrio sp. SNU_ST1]